jgi:hypothetical protein
MIQNLLTQLARAQGGVAHPPEQDRQCRLLLPRILLPPPREVNIRRANESSLQHLSVHSGSFLNDLVDIAVESSVWKRGDGIDVVNVGLGLWV